MCIDLRDRDGIPHENNELSLDNFYLKSIIVRYPRRRIESESQLQSRVTSLSALYNSQSQRVDLSAVSGEDLN